MTESSCQVAILMGSKSDEEQMKPCGEVLKSFGISYEARVLSAHRTPRETSEFIESARKRGVRVVIAAAGGAAHLAGVCAAHTDLPVIGVPIESQSLKGLDSLLSTVQMPPGIPVACVAIGTMGSRNAAYLAARILGVSDDRMAGKVREESERMRQKILQTRCEV